MSARVKLTDVAKRFRDSIIFDDLDLQIDPGSFVAVMGPSGCGKSTLLRLLAGLEMPDVGRVQVDVGAQARPRISFVFQEAQLLPWRSVLQNVALPLELDGVDSREVSALARDALIRVGLGEALQKYPHELSGGMKMRVSLARALVTRPHLLLLDEPFAALDDVTRFRLQNDLRAFWLAERMTVIFVTHSMTEAAYLADRQIMLSRRPAEILLDRVSELPTHRQDALRVSSVYLFEIEKLQSQLQDALLQAARQSRAQGGWRLDEEFP